MAVSCNGYGKPPAKLVDFDCASIFTSSSSVPDIIFETTPSAFKRSLLPDGEWQWSRTQIITSNISKQELGIAIAKIPQALDPEENRSVTAWCHPVVMRCQELELIRLLPSIVKGEAFVFQPADEKTPLVSIPLTRLNELVRVIKASAIHSTTPQDNQNADGLILLQGTSPSLYLGDASDVLIAENPHIYVTPDNKVHTLAELLIKHSAGTWSNEDRSAELKNLGRMLKGLHVSVRVGSTVEERVISAIWDGNSKSTPSRLRHHAWTLKRGDYPLADLPCVNVGCSLDPVLLPQNFAMCCLTMICVVSTCPAFHGRSKPCAATPLW